MKKPSLVKEALPRKQLEEKAKTLKEILTDLHGTRHCDLYSKEGYLDKRKWVLLSKHQQAYTELEEVFDRCRIDLDNMRKERELQKQKLQELSTEIENLRRHNHYDAKTDMWQIPQRQLFALEKEAKTLLGL